MPRKVLCQEISAFLVEGLSCAMNNACNIFVILINFIYIGALKDPTLNASFGLGISYFMFIFTSINLASFEVTGIECAYWWGKSVKENPNKITKLNAGLGKGLILISIFLIFTSTMFAFSGDILYGIGILPENAELAGRMLRWLIPGSILQAYNFQLQAFVLAQGNLRQTKNFFRYHEAVWNFKHSDHCADCLSESMVGY
jgi:Na+-driven multidrug efflux pump